MGFGKHYAEIIKHMTDEQYIKLIDLISDSTNIDQLKKIGQLISQLPDSPQKQDLANTLVQRAALL